ncbi:MAG: hypothetical protein NWF01_03095 [Candidatus Bathyarchaeota archaeon]|nr:hypothetical protein [Candidatus Bathyarchaeota archaeon]
MTETQFATPGDLRVDLTLHSVSANLLQEFAQKIVKPYFGGNLNSALLSLMEKAIVEQAIEDRATSKI